MNELTGQLNRARLADALTNLSSSASRSPTNGAFLLAGVNDLTLINETCGFDVGDEVISMVGKRLARVPARQGLLEDFTGNDRSILERLTVEITETAAISDVKAAVKFVSSLKELGARVALNDFGAGYTSFRSLRELGVDMVKIDGSLIQNVGTDAEEMFVCTLIDLARSFGVVTVGEWCVTRRPCSCLRGPGCPTCRAISSGSRSSPGKL